MTNQRSDCMGQAKIRKRNDPLYGVVPKKGVMSPLWVVHRGVLFLVGEGDSIACLPAGNMITLNEEQLGVLEEIIASNPSLLNGQGPSPLPGPPRRTDAGGSMQVPDIVTTPSSDGTTSGTIDMTQEGSIPTMNITTINGINPTGPSMVDLL